MPKITWLTSYGHQALTRSLIRDRNTLCTTASPPAVCWTGEDALPTTTKVFYIKQFAFFKTVDSIAGTHLSASPRKHFLPAQTRSPVQFCCVFSLSAGEAGLLRQFCTWHFPEPCMTTATTAGQQL